MAGGTYRVGDLDLTRIGYGAMQLAGPGVFGPPEDRPEAVRVLRTAVELGINHIDTADFYGPHVTNEIVHEALHPYDGVHVVTKIGAVRDEAGNWVHEHEPDQLRRHVEGNLERLGVDRLDVVNLRITGSGIGGSIPAESPISAYVETVAAMQQEGLIRHIGLSTVTAAQVAEAQRIAPVVCVQNMYNIANRADDELIDSLAEQGIAYVPYFPLGGFSPLQSETLGKVAASLDATPLAVALAWLLQRSPNILLIPGTSSVAHLRENVAGAALELPEEALAELDAISA
ncbi:MAG: oxidoreductase [Nocardioides sp.]|nr:oxidoreductase [Nocardioides sp.]